MGLPRKIVMVAGAAAAVAAAARLLRHWTPPLPPPAAGDPERFPWRHAELFLTRRGSGPPALLLHDLYTGASGAEMEPLGDRLAGSFTVHTVDLPGFGRSGRPRMRYDPALYVDAVMELVRHGIGAPTLLVGSGLSAGFAVHAAARLGGEASGVVLLAPLEPDVSRGTTSPALRPLLYQLLRSPFGELYHHLHATTAWRRHALRQDLAVEPGDLTARADSLRRHARQPDGGWPLWSLWVGDLDWDPRRLLARLAAPTLVLWGAEARSNPAAPELYDAVRPDLTQEVTPDTARWPHVDAPDAVAASIRSWWAAEGAVAAGDDGRSPAA